MEDAKENGYANPTWDMGVALGETLSASGTAHSARSTNLAAGNAAWVGRLPSNLGDLRQGGTLAHFVVLGELGAGGMGVVLAAYDPALDRRVAIKVLRADRDVDSSSSSASARLLREAQALAKLSHPNVITIYEVASTNDRVAVVMEYIDGPTLTAWLAEETRDWRSVVHTFSQAGRGLAAAHHAGLIHRDFKPDNVLIGKDGRVRVTDFGLVSSLDTAEATRKTASDSDVGADNTEFPPPSSTELSPTLTRAGALIGTLAYMAPEQLRRTPADARSDQFSFCVSLYEGLYGHRPFPGHTFGELSESVQAGKVTDAPTQSHVPTWVRDIVLRGLRPDPAARHDSMDSLIEALGRDPRQRRMRVAAGLAALGLLAIAIVGFSRSRDVQPAAVCTDMSDRLSGVWDNDVRTRVRAAFGAVKGAHAEESLRLLESGMDRRTQAWITARVDTCRATRVRGEQSEHLLDLRMQCLDRRLGELRALTSLFDSDPDAKLVDNAVAALSKTTPLAVCEDTEALTAATPLPEHPAARQRVLELRARLDDAAAFERSGQYKKGIALAKLLVEDLEPTDYPPVRAEVLGQVATLLAEGSDAQEAEAAFDAALQAAAVAHDDIRVADAWARLIMLIGARQGKYARALALRRTAEIALARAGDAPEPGVRLESSLGLVLTVKGDYSEAREHHIRALRLFEKSFEPNQPRIAMLLGNVATVMAEQAQYAEAQQYYMRALAIQRKSLGAHHPKIGYTLNNLGNVVGYQGNNEQAVAYYQQALAIWDDALPANHPLIGSCLNNLGSAQSELGALDEAQTSYERALAIFIAKFGADHPAVATLTGNLGELEVTRGNFSKAMTLCRKALDIYHMTLGKKHPDNAYALTCIGRAQLGASHARQAIDSLTRALALRKSSSGDKLDLAETQFALARALAATTTHRERAIALALSSRKSYADAGAHKRHELAEVEAALQGWTRH